MKEGSSIAPALAAAGGGDVVGAVKLKEHDARPGEELLRCGFHGGTGHESNNGPAQEWTDGAKVALIGLRSLALGRVNERTL